MIYREFGLIVFALIFIAVFWFGCEFAHKNPKDEKSLITVPNWVSKLYLSKRKDIKLIFTLMVNEIFVVLGLLFAVFHSIKLLPISLVGPIMLLISGLALLLNVLHFLLRYFSKKD